MTRTLTIAGTLISDDTDPWIIAELGHNHGGSVARCQDLIAAAATAGANAVKLQKRHNRTLYTPEFYAQPYTGENAFGPTYGEHREALEFKDTDYRTLERYATSQRVTFFATPFDHTSADFLADTINAPCFKIASSDLINLPLLEHVAHFQVPVLLSTGAASQADVDRAVTTITAINPQLAILHCTAAYPAPAELLNLNVITTYRERYPDFVIGFSSHYSGISDTIAAYVLGARIFEKHFTLDRTAKGTDHAFSLEPAGFAKMVSYLRKTRRMLGSPTKSILPAELPAIDKMRRSTRWFQEQQQPYAIR